MCLEVRRKRVSVHVPLTSDNATSCPLRKHIQQCRLARTGLAHEGCELPRGRIPRNILQKLPSLACPDGNNIIEVVERESVVHLRRRLFHLPGVDPFYITRDCVGARAALLLIGSGLLLSGLDDLRLGAAFEEHDARLARQALVELGENEEDSDEADAEGADDAKVLYVMGESERW